MKVRIYEMNYGTTTKYYGLMNAEDNTPLMNFHVWKTEKGAIRWAEKNGYKVVK